MNEQKKQAWIEKGYGLVAEKGLENLTVNSICRAMAKSKSSFYHYFGEIELFRDELMAYHVARAHDFALKVKSCENIDPDLISVFMDYQTDVFFYKQLCIYRKPSTFEKYKQKVFELYEHAALDKWADYFELNNRKIFVGKFNKFISEHFLMSISLDTYTQDWIKNYLIELLEMVQQMKKGS
ncbi:MAG: TetR/AcrR family transcriptional regulator [Bacteroidota bacterium]